MALAIKCELLLKAYKCEVQESFLQIAKYQKVVEDKNAFLIDNEVKLLSLESNVLDMFKKLKKEDNYAYK